MPWLLIFFWSQRNVLLFATSAVSQVTWSNKETPMKQSCRNETSLKKCDGKAGWEEMVHTRFLMTRQISIEIHFPELSIWPRSLKHLVLHLLTIQVLTEQENQSFLNNRKNHRSPQRSHKECFSSICVLTECRQKQNQLAAQTSKCC